MEAFLRLTTSYFLPIEVIQCTKMYMFSMLILATGTNCSLQVTVLTLCLS